MKTVNYAYLVFICTFPVLSFAFGFDESRPDTIEPIREYSFGSELVFTVDDTDATFKIKGPESDFVNKRLFGSYLLAYQSSSVYEEFLPSIELCAFRGNVFAESLFATVDNKLIYKNEDYPEYSWVVRRSFIDEFINGIKTNSYILEKEEGAINKYAASFAYEYLYIAENLLNHGLAVLEHIETDRLSDIRKDELTDFIENDKLFSTPSGYHTWTVELGNYYPCDRWLQRGLDPANDVDLLTATGLAKAVTVNERHEEKYDAIINLYSYLANPPATFSVLDITNREGFENCLIDEDSYRRFQNGFSGGDVICFFPPAYSRESEMSVKLEGVPIAAGDLMDTYISAIKSGNISLEPEPNSGWYDYEQYALEVFLKPDSIPESSKFEIDDNYRNRLESSFRSVLTSVRSITPRFVSGSASAYEDIPDEATIKPDFRLEPLPTYYLRNAEAHGFLNDNVISPDSKFSFLKIGNEYPLREDGQRDIIRVGKYGEWVEDLYKGFYLVSCADIGLKLEIDSNETSNPEELVKESRIFLDNWFKDPVMAKDIRDIVPIAYTDNNRSGIDNWCIFGVVLTEIEVEYEKRPDINILIDGVEIEMLFEPSHYTIAVPVFAEVITPGNEPYTREEFRAICDKYETKNEIIAALERGER